MSGGANKGSYEVGVVHGLAHILDEGETNWDVITGVSAGSLNTVGMSLFPVGAEREMSEFMVKTFSNFTTSTVYE